MAKRGRPRVYTENPTPEVAARRRALARDGDQMLTSNPLDLLKSRGLVSPTQADAGLPVITLKPGEDRRVRRGHLWVFSNEVKTFPPSITPSPQRPTLVKRHIYCYIRSSIASHII